MLCRRGLRGGARHAAERAQVALQLADRRVRGVLRAVQDDFEVPAAQAADIGKAAESVVAALLSATLTGIRRFTAQSTWNNLRLRPDMPLMALLLVLTVDPGPTMV